MTSQYRHRRFSDPTKVFTALEPGEIGVNTANRQLVVGDANSGSLGAPLPLIGVRTFDTRGIYAPNDYVSYFGVLYRANVTTTPGAFTASQWDAIAGLQIGPFVLRGGDSMSGNLGLPPAGAGPAHAVRKDYVDGAINVTRSYVDSQMSLLPVLKTGGTMTGPLILSGSPTAPLQAATKTYVDTSGPPPGAVMDFAMATAPSGWLVCDGQEVDRVTYGGLFAAIGVLWGSGNSVTTFNVPNFASRYRRHRDDNSSYANTVGTYQDPCNMSHYHNVNLNSGYVSSDHAHYVSGTTGASDRDLNHQHSGVPQQQGLYTVGSVIGSSAGQYVHAGDGNSGFMDRSIDHLHNFGAWTGGISSNHYHNISGATSGGSADGNETRPYSATVLTCIRY